MEMQGTAKYDADEGDDDDDDAGFDEDDDDVEDDGDDDEGTCFALFVKAAVIRLIIPYVTFAGDDEPEEDSVGKRKASGGDSDGPASKQAKP